MKNQTTRKEKREAEKKINFFEEFLQLRKHFYCHFNQTLKSVNDVRHTSYITYEPDVLLFTMIMKNVSGIHSMNKMTKDFNNDTVINNFSKVLGYN
ncbi:MAG: transposase, partial [Romboutsia sp.]|nr:transposase [Romboutsia sp.]